MKATRRRHQPESACNRGAWCRRRIVVVRQSPCATEGLGASDASSWSARVHVQRRGLVQATRHCRLPESA